MRGTPSPCQARGTSSNSIQFLAANGRTRCIQKQAPRAVSLCALHSFHATVCCTFVREIAAVLYTSVLQGCHPGASKKKPPTDVEATAAKGLGDGATGDLQICLKCGDVLCKHCILKHVQGKRHPLTCNARTFECWCDSCNARVNLDVPETRSVLDCINAIRQVNLLPLDAFAAEADLYSKSQIIASLPCSKWCQTPTLI